jgi:hypothetical protein
VATCVSGCCVLQAPCRALDTVHKKEFLSQATERAYSNFNLIKKKYGLNSIIIIIIIILIKLLIISLLGKIHLSPSVCEISFSQVEEIHPIS